MEGKQSSKSKKGLEPCALRPLVERLQPDLIPSSCHL